MLNFKHPSRVERRINMWQVMQNRRPVRHPPSVIRHLRPHVYNLNRLYRTYWRDHHSQSN